MKRTISYFLSLFILLSAAPLYATQTQTLTAYYPTPNGNYSKIQASSLILAASQQSNILDSNQCSFSSSCPYSKSPYIQSDGTCPCPAGLMYYDTLQREMMISNGSDFLAFTASAPNLDIGGYHINQVMDLSGVWPPPVAPSPGISSAQFTNLHYVSPNKNNSPALDNDNFLLNDASGGNAGLDQLTIATDPNDIDTLYGPSPGQDSSPARVQPTANNTGITVDLSNIPHGTLLITYGGDINIDQFIYNYMDKAPNGHAGSTTHNYQAGDAYNAGYLITTPPPVPVSSGGVTICLQWKPDGWKNLDCTPLFTDDDAVNTSGTYDPNTAVLSNLFSNGDTYTPVNFSRTYSFILPHPTPSAESFRLVITKSGASGSNTVSCAIDDCGSNSDKLTLYYVEPVAVQITDLSMSVQYQQT